MITRPPFSVLSKGSPIPVLTPDGINIAAYEWGNPNGSELLFVHGFSQSYLAFSKQFCSELAEHFRIIAFDLRGHGESDKPTSQEAYSDGRRWADDVAAVIKSAQLTNPYLIGWSLGGRVVAQYLDVYGDHALAGVILVGARAAAPSPSSFFGVGAAALPQMLALESDDNIQATIRFLHECFEQQPSANDFAYMLAYNMLTPPYVRRGIQAWHGVFNDVMKRIEVPTLVVHGTEDRIVARDAAEFTTSLIAGSKLVWIEGAGHSPFWENPDAFNAEIRLFASSAQASQLNPKQ